MSRLRSINRDRELKYVDLEMRQLNFDITCVSADSKCVGFRTKPTKVDKATSQVDLKYVTVS